MRLYTFWFQAKDRLKLTEHCCLTHKKFALLATVQYLVSLGMYGACLESSLQLVKFMKYYVINII